jgi:ribosomal protein L37AE/L43A
MAIRIVCPPHYARRGEDGVWRCVECGEPTR